MSIFDLSRLVGVTITMSLFMLLQHSEHSTGTDYHGEAYATPCTYSWVINISIGASFKLSRTFRSMMCCIRSSTSPLSVNIAVQMVAILILRCRYKLHSPFRSVSKQFVTIEGPQTLVLYCTCTTEKKTFNRHSKRSLLPRHDLIVAHRR